MGVGWSRSRGQGGQKPDSFVDAINGWTLRTPVTLPQLSSLTQAINIIVKTIII